MTTHWKAVERSVTVVCYSILPVCNFGKFTRFGLGTVRSARVKEVNLTVISDRSPPEHYWRE